MSARVIHLADYRDGVKLEGLTVVWRGLRHTLEPRHALRMAEEIYEKRARRLRIWQIGVAGFVVTSDRLGNLTLTGWDMGPGKIPAREVLDFNFSLAKAAKGVA